LIGKEFIMKMNILFAIFAFAVISIQPQAIASDRFMILVHDNYGNYVANALVEVLVNGQQINSGYTDNSGMFIAVMESNTRYRITASGNGLSGEWQGFPQNSRIDIYMQ
jgi:hypothetical protein